VRRREGRGSAILCATGVDSRWMTSPKRSTSPSRLGKPAPFVGYSNPNKQSYATISPGPGAYATADEIGKLSPSYSMVGPKSRALPLSSGDSPGPAEYSTRNESPSPVAFSMKGRHEIKDSKVVPGPGAYQPGNMKQSTMYSIRGGKPGRAFGGEGSKDTPGPGAYGSPDPKRGRQKPAFTIRARVSPPKQATEVPGPGTYSANPPRSPSPEYSMSSKTGSSYLENIREMSKVPGPGQYSPSDSQTAKKLSFTLGGGMDRSLI